MLPVKPDNGPKRALVAAASREPATMNHRQQYDHSEIEYVSYTIAGSVNGEWGPWYVDNGSAASLIAKRTIDASMKVIHVTLNMKLKRLSGNNLSTQQAVVQTLEIDVREAILSLQHLFWTVTDEVSPKYAGLIRGDLMTKYDWIPRLSQCEMYISKYTAVLTRHSQRVVWSGSQSAES